MSGGGDLKGWPRIIAEHYRGEFASLESVVVQRSCVEMREHIAHCQKRDGVFDGPVLAFDDFIGAKARLKMKQVPGIDGIPMELLASRGAVAEATIHSLCVSRTAGDAGHTARVDHCSDWLLQAIPKARKESEFLGSWRPLCLQCPL